MTQDDNYTEANRHPDDPCGDDAPAAETPVEDAAAPAAETQPHLAEDSLARIFNAQEKARKARSEYLLLKEDTKDAKDRWEAATTDLEKIIEEEKQPNLFTPKQEGSAPASSDETDDAWRAVELSTLPDLTPGILKALAGANPPIITIGDHADYMKPKGDYEPRLTDIKGIGKGTVDKIDAALELFWTDWKVKQLDRAKAANEVAQDDPADEPQGPAA